MAERQFQYNLEDADETEVTVLYYFHAGDGKTIRHQHAPDADPAEVEDIRYIDPETGQEVHCDDGAMRDYLEEACWNDVYVRDSGMRESNDGH